ncbi:MAG TPA: hypothetical protein VKF61_02770 [Candidatus Polarisedimenticolia bacterium]|nr:hypothetical protein [Candidatus Polarisedimenticolia bacterium]
MHEVVEGRWEKARRLVIARWREILKRIEARDEPGVLVLANIIDEFCEEAIATRLAVLHGQAPSEIDVLKFARSAGLTGTRCVFCLGFQEQGGCFGMLASLNNLVTSGKWDDARQVAVRYVVQLESMRFADIAEAPIH